MDDYMKSRVTIKFNNKLPQTTLKKRLDFFEPIHMRKQDNQYECIICYENVNRQDNVAQLGCGHSFCIGCFSQHIRVSGSCPLCRKDIINKPKQIEELPDQVMTQIILFHMQNKYQDRQSLSIREYFKSKLDHYYNPYRHGTTNGKDIKFTELNRDLLDCIMEEVTKFARDVSGTTSEWYMR